MRTRTLSLAAAFLSVLIGCGPVFINRGSKNATLAFDLAPSQGVKPKAQFARAQKVIGDFEDGSKDVNRRLYGNPTGAWMALSWAGNNAKGDFAAAGGANKTRMAAHVYGSLVDRGDSQYPGFMLMARLTTSGAYDASPFSGIRFHYKCPLDDTALKRRFSIATAPTTPASNGGTCPRGCWNHYGMDLAVTGDWELESYDFSDLKRESGWGAPVMPPDITDHLAEFLALQWVHSGTNIPATFNIDYWVDEVEFF